MADEREPEPAAPSETEPAKVPEADAEPAEADADEPAARAATPVVEARRSRARVVKWWWFLIAALVIEFWLYGRRGHIDVCVGMNGETDFALIGAERTDENRWKFPRCEQRLNLGLESHYDEAVDEALRVGCRGATIFHHQGQGKACMAADKGWIHRIEVSHCPPWHGHFWEHLFWFLK
jgi:hypothetical protein